MGQGQVGLGDDDREVPVAEILEVGELLGRGRSDVDPVSSVDLGGHLGELVDQGVLEIVGVAEVGVLVARRNDRTSQIDGAVATVDDMGRGGEVSTGHLCHLTDGVDLVGMVAREDVEGHHRGDAEVSDDLDVLAQVGGTGKDVVRIVLKHRRGQGLSRNDLVATGMGLEGTHGDDEDGGVGAHTTEAALDVEEPLGAHVGAESGLRQQVVAAADADAVGDDRRVARGDVAEGAGVDEHWAVLGGLQQVRLDGVLEDDRHRPGGMQVLRGDWLLGAVVADDDTSKPGAQV